MSDANKPSWESNPRCDEEQLAILHRCSEAGAMLLLAEACPFPLAEHASPNNVEAWHPDMFTFGLVVTYEGRKP